MPNIIKSESVIEEKNTRAINLLDITFPIGKDDDTEEYTPNFSENLTSTDKEDDSFKKYYMFDLDNETEDACYEKYFTGLSIAEDDFEYKKYYDVIDETEQIIESKSKMEIAESEDDVPDTLEEFVDVVQEIEEYVSEPFQEELKNQIIEEARGHAKTLVEKAKIEAETLRMKLVAEISEAEVKKELAKSMAQNTIDEANDEYEKILETAHIQAKEILEKAQSDGYEIGMAQGTDEGYQKGVERGLEEGRRTGNEKGYQDGFAAGHDTGCNEGYQKAYAEMRQNLVVSTREAKDILLAAQKEKENIVNSADEQIIEIAMSIARKVLNKEFNENPFSILQVVKEAMQKVTDQPRIFVTINPSNYELVKMAANDIKKSLGSKQEITVVADNTLDIADVIVGTGGSGDVDARLETQMSEIRKTIETVIQQ